MSAKFIGKNDGVLPLLIAFPALPQTPRRQPVLRLFLIPLFQQVQHKRRGGNHSHFVVFQRGKRKASVRQWPLLKLFIDGKPVFLKVDTVPCQPQSLAQPEAGKDHHLEQRPEAVISRLGHHLAYLFVGKGLDFPALYTGQRHRFGGVAPHILQLDSGGEAFAEDTMNVADGFGVKRLCPSLSPQEGIIKGLDEVWVQLGERITAQGRQDVGFHLGLIVFNGGPFLIKHILVQPNPHPLFQGHFRRFYVNSGIDLHCDLSQLFPNLFLGLAIDGFLHLLSGSRIEASGEPGLPATVRAFADGPRTLRVFPGFARHNTPFRVGPVLP